MVEVIHTTMACRPPTMLDNQPFVSAGMEFDCLDRGGELAPVYVRVVGMPHWGAGHSSVNVTVQLANFTDFFYGKVKIHGEA